MGTVFIISDMYFENTYYGAFTTKEAAKEFITKYDADNQESTVPGFLITEIQIIK